MSKEVVHRFLRQPDFQASVTSRIGNRYNPFKNTLTKLEDPQNNRTLYLIGTTNSSTTLAHRTRKLLQEVQPHSLYVQASNTWWSHAKHSTVINISYLVANTGGILASPRCSERREI